MKLITALLSLMLGASFACAADQEKKKDDSKKDDSKTGEQKRLSPKDFAKEQEERFTMLDANKDGFVSKDEFNASPMAKQPGAAERFGKLDRNNDDKLTKREFSVRLPKEPGSKPEGEGDKAGPKKPGEAAKKPEDKK